MLLLLMMLCLELNSENKMRNFLQDRTVSLFLFFMGEKTKGLFVFLRKCWNSEFHTIFGFVFVEKHLETYMIFPILTFLL